MKVATGRWSVVSLFLSMMLLALWSSTEAQQPAKVPRVGYLTGTRRPTQDAPDANRDAFRQGLRDLGYIEGKNIHVEYRYVEARNDRIPGLLNELLQLKVDVLVSPHIPSILAAKQATKTIPIVMVTTRDPVATGLVDSLARPGGNITGLTRLTRQLSGKRLELLKDMLPTISRVALLLDADSITKDMDFKQYEPAARALKLALKPLEVRSSGPDFEKAFQSAANNQVSAIMIQRSPLFIDNRQRIAQLALEKLLPSMSEGSVFVEAGMLASYSSDENDSFRRAALYVDKILKGAKPADLPVEQPTKFELMINLKTAKQIGVTIPQSVLYRADRVIK